MSIVIMFCGVLNIISNKFKNLPNIKLIIIAYLNNF